MHLVHQALMLYVKLQAYRTLITRNLNALLMDEGLDKPSSDAPMLLKVSLLKVIVTLNQGKILSMNQ